MHRIITAIIILGSVQLASALEAKNIHKLLMTRSPHPTQLTVRYGDQRLPVIRMKKWAPIVLIDGAEKKLRNERDYMTMRAASYGPEQVELTKVDYGGMQYLDVETFGKALYGAHPGHAEFKGTFKSRRALKDGFITIVIFTPSMFVSQEYQDILGIYVFTKELTDLPAGKEVRVRFMTKMFAVLPGQRYFVHVFDRNGREAKTNIMQNGWPYYSMTERKLLNEAIVRYKGRFASKDHAVTPIVMMNPLLPEEMSPPDVPISATFAVSTEGHVKDITVSNADNKKLRTAVLEAVQGWLFLPQLIKGKPVESLVEVPIQF